jgi:hypothetical protein
VDICSLPPVLQAKLDLLHDGVKEWLHVTANGFCNVSNGDERLNDDSQNGEGKAKR